MLTTSVLLGMAVALLRGGDLRRLGGDTIRFWWVLVLAFGVKFLVGLAGREEFSALAPTGPAVHVLSYVVVLAVLLVNRDLPWMWLVWAGVAANLIVVSANGGLMPVWDQALLMLGKEGSVARLHAGGDVMHAPFTAATRLPWLGDWIPAPGPVAAVVSPGDMIMAVGVILFINTLTQPSYRIPRNAAPGTLTEKPQA